MKWTNKKIPCKTCGHNFTPKSSKNIYCSRKCFKKDYYRNKRVNNVKKFPVFICKGCQSKFVLDFDPVKKSNKWLGFKCPNCNALTINVSENVIMQDKPLE